MSLARFCVREALSTPPTVPDFVLPGLEVGEVGTLVGPGGVGKTFLLLSIGVCIALGLPILRGAFPAARAGRVVILLGEESSRTIARRLHAMVNALTDDWRTNSGRTGDDALISQLEQAFTIYPMHGQDSLLLRSGQRTRLVDELCSACEGARLLVIDPLRRLHDGDENDTGAMTATVQMMEAIAHTAGCAVIASHHSNRASAIGDFATTVDASRGSTALPFGVRWQANLAQMSPQQAAALGVSESRRECFVRLDIPKHNHCGAQPTVWLERDATGVLGPASLNPQTRSKVNRRPATGVRYA